MNKTEIEKKVNYEFSDPALLERAFTHNSASSDPARNYQSLEFLGDSILDFIIAKRLLELYPSHNEGTLTKMRSMIVSEQPLAKAMKKLGISDNLITGSGEARQNLSDHDSINADLFEAISAAIYLDGGGIEAAERFILNSLNEEIGETESSDSVTDAKSELNEYAAKHGMEITYNETERSGPPHRPAYRYTVTVGGEIMGEGEGGTKREAQRIAASAALRKIKSKIRKNK